jgi:hypothetical protein
MTLYDISQTDPTDILGDDIVNTDVRSPPASHAGPVDPLRVRERLQNLSTVFDSNDDDDEFSSEESDSFGSDFSETDGSDTLLDGYGSML